MYRPLLCLLTAPCWGRHTESPIFSMTDLALIFNFLIFYGCPFWKIFWIYQSSGLWPLWLHYNYLEASAWKKEGNKVPESKIISTHFLNLNKKKERLPGSCLFSILFHHDQRKTTSEWEYINYSIVCDWGWWRMSGVMAGLRNIQESGQGAEGE